MHSSAANSLVELVKFFSFFKKPEERSHGAKIKSAAADENGVIKDSSDFGEHGSDVFGSQGDLEV